MQMLAGGTGTSWGRLPDWSARPRVRLEALLAGVCVYFVLLCNGPFWHAALSGRAALSPSTWLFAGGVALALAAFHFFFLALACNRWTAKPVLALLMVATGFAGYFMQHYQVYFDTSMVRNVLRTDVGEARDLLTPSLLVHLLAYAGLPLLLLWRVDIIVMPWRHALLRRVAWLAVALGVAVGSTLLVYQDLAALMRNQKAVRHLITPGNLIVSTLRVLAAEQTRPQGPKVPVGKDAHLGTSWSGRSKPAVLVVGETARATNWGLNDYPRQTTPELARRDVINFAQVTSCGTNTEVSVPCLFSPFGRHDYDEARIHDHESLLHVLRHAGIGVLWRDNQSGCKGVCSDIETEQAGTAQGEPPCDREDCLDEVLLQGLNERLQRTPGNLVIVLHQMGNHGPAYFKRYPASQAAYLPTCDTAELGACTREQIVNSYDNAIRYTDQFLARTVDMLQKQTSHDAAMIYVSDHGESLGEGGVFLHGLPRAIAPEVQTHVPMVMWMTPGFAQPLGLRADCLRQRASQPASHDNLFHTVLGVLDVRTSVYDRNRDLTAACR